MLPLLPRTDTKGLRRLLLSAQARVAASRATPFESASEAALSAGAVPPAQAGGTRGMQSPCLPVPPGTRRSLRSRLRGFRAAKSPSHRETPVSFLRRRPTAFQRPLRRSQSPEATSAPPWGGREDSEKAGGDRCHLLSDASPPITSAAVETWHSHGSLQGGRVLAALRAAPPPFPRPLPVPLRSRGESDGWLRR